MDKLSIDTAKMWTKKALPEREGLCNFTFGTVIIPVP